MGELSFHGCTSLRLAHRRVEIVHAPGVTTRRNGLRKTTKSCRRGAQTRHDDADASFTAPSPQSLVPNPSRCAVRIALVAGLAGLLVHAALAQGRTDYFNVETPQVKPVAIATIAGTDYLLAGNTTDNSVEVWSSSIPAARLARIPVGLEPCSVVWSSERSAFYTTDFLSDSVTVVLLAAPTGPTSLTYTVDRTVNVGDEPVHLALTPDAN